MNTPDPVPVPSQFYQLPPLPTVELEKPNESSPDKPNDATEADKPAFGIRAGFPMRKGFVEECPNSMKCLRESYCQEINPNEGSTDVFDIRLSFRKATRLKVINWKVSLF